MQFSKTIFDLFSDWFIYIYRLVNRITLKNIRTKFLYNNYLHICTQFEMSQILVYKKFHLDRSFYKIRLQRHFVNVQWYFTKFFEWQFGIILEHFRDIIKVDINSVLLETCIGKFFPSIAKTYWLKCGKNLVTFIHNIIFPVNFPWPPNFE